MVMMKQWMGVNEEEDESKEWMNEYEWKENYLDVKKKRSKQEEIKRKAKDKS